MTVIAAVARDGKITMAADTATNYAGTTVHSATKVRRIAAATGGTAGQMLLAFSGAGGLAPLVTRQLKVDGPPAAAADVVVQDWADRLASAVTAIAVGAEPPLTTTGEGETFLSGACLLGWGGRLWYLFTHQAVPVPDGIAAIGSGCDVALGVLHTEMSYDADPDQACLRAVQLACTLAPGCYLTSSGPLVDHLPWSTEASS